jgi:hypothetical protein
MLEFKKSIDPDGLKADLSDDTAVINVVVQIWIYTKPGDGLFEVTVNHNLKKNTTAVSSDKSALKPSRSIVFLNPSILFSGNNCCALKTLFSDNLSHSFL